MSHLATLAKWWEEAKAHAAPTVAARAVGKYVRENGEADLEELRELLTEEGIEAPLHLHILSGLVDAGVLEESHDEGGGLLYKAAGAERLSLVRLATEQADEKRAKEAAGPEEKKADGEGKAESKREGPPEGPDWIPWGKSRNGVPRWKSPRSGEIRYQDAMPASRDKEGDHPEEPSGGNAAPDPGIVKNLLARLREELSIAGLVKRAKQVASGVVHPVASLKAVKDKARERFKWMQDRYGKAGAAAVAGCYLGYYVASAFNPMLLAVVPAPSAVLVGTAELFRAAARKLMGKKAAAAVKLATAAGIDLDQLTEDCLDALHEIHEAAGEDMPEFNHDAVAAVLAYLLEQLGKGEEVEEGGEKVNLAHAPKGGVTIGGHSYRGGEFVPDDIARTAARGAAGHLAERGVATVDQLAAHVADSHGLTPEAARSALIQLHKQGVLRLGKYTGALDSRGRTKLPAEVDAAAASHEELGHSPSFDGRTDWYPFVGLTEEGHRLAGESEGRATSSTTSPPELWQLPLAEYQKLTGSKSEGGHRARVEKAMAEGKTVPPEVLADYPDLASRRKLSHAPKGGATIHGIAYPGGQFIPGDVAASAPPDVQAKLSGPNERGGGDAASAAPPGSFPGGTSEHHATAVAKVGEWLAASPGLPVERVRHYQSAVSAVLGRMSGECVRRLLANTKGVHFHAGLDPLRRHYLSAGGPPRSLPGGFWTFYAGDAAGDIHLDGGSDMGDVYPDQTRDIYAHEFGHAVDGTGREFSTDAGWKAAWASEINVEGDPVTKYARKNQQEGFAEFARLVFTEPDVAREGFPRCWAFWRTKGLV